MRDEIFSKNHPTNNNRVLLIESHVLFGDLVKHHLVKSGFLCENVDSLDSALFDFIDNDVPDLIVLAVNLPNLSELEVLARLREICPDIPVCIMSSRRSALVWPISQAYGAMGCFSKSISMAEFSSVIYLLLNGYSVYGPSRDPKSDLDQDERVFLDLMVNKEIAPIVWKVLSGCSNDEISDALDISPTSVKSRLKAVYRRLGVSNRTAAVMRICDVISGAV